MGQSKALSCNISALRVDALDAVDVRDVFLEVGHGSEGLQNMGSRSVLGTQYDVCWHSLHSRMWPYAWDIWQEGA